MRRKPSIAAILALLWVLPAAYCHEGVDVLAVYAFTALTPPSNLFTVGSVLAIEEGQTEEGQTAKFKLVCGPRASLGPAFVAMSSSTIGSALKKSSKSKWNLEGQALSGIQATGAGEHVQSIRATLVNAKILSLSDADVLENLPNRSEECRRAISQRLSQGYALTMVAAALLADMQYEITWKSSASVDKRVRIQQMQSLAASLGGGQRKVSMTSIESTGLALGIRTDPFLLALSVPEMYDVKDDIVGRAKEELQKPSRVVEVDANPDAPLVPPPGGYASPTFVPD